MGKYLKVDFKDFKDHYRYFFSTSLFCVFEDSVMVVRDDENGFFISLPFLLDVISLYQNICLDNCGGRTTENRIIAWTREKR